MFKSKSNTKHKHVFVSDLAPENKVKHKPKETSSQALISYEIKRDKVQTDFKPRPTPEVAEGKKSGGKKQLLNF